MSGFPKDQRLINDASDGDWLEVKMCMGVELKRDRHTAVIHSKCDYPFSNSARFFRSAIIVMVNPGGVIHRDPVFARLGQYWRSGDDDYVARVSHFLR